MTYRIIFHPKAREAIRALSGELKDEIGQALFLLQQGFKLSMPLSRAMPAVGRGVGELRIRGRAGVCRIFYCAQSSEGIVVFHVFMKKTQKTPPLEIELGKKRLREMGHG